MKEYINKENGDEPRIQYIINETTKNYWCSEKKEWQYFTIVFHDYYVSLKSYTIQAGDWETNADYPQKWIVSGLDYDNWVNLSNIVDSGIRESLQSKTFYLNESRNVYKGFRLMMTDKSLAGSFHFCINNFDIFGKVIYKFNFTCIRRNFSHYILMITPLILYVKDK